jgi:putative ubiquitin-RnfH superfamily antitoxin RatB of RatAB toxin-antitoxin module
MGSEPAHIIVELLYAEPGHALAKALRLAVPATIEDAVRLAAGDPDFARVDLAHCAVGVFGRLAAPGHPLHDGDRVEFYRPLAVDPKSARRMRARDARKKT